MKRLETRLGFQLFVRANRRVALSPEGEALLAKVRVLTSAMEGVDTAIWELRREVRPRLRLGSPKPMVSIPQRNSLVTELCVRHPSVSLEIDDHGTVVLVDQLKAGALDATLVTGPISLDSLDSQLIAVGRPLIAVRRDDKLASQNSVRLSDLKNVKIAVQRYRERPPCVRARFDQLEAAGAITIEAPENHAGSMLEFAARIGASTVVHQWAAENPESASFPHDFAFRPLVGAKFDLEVYLVRRPNTTNVAAHWLWDIASELALMRPSPEMVN
jgi:DNA-binding transcriptional LysR family regulator